MKGAAIVSFAVLVAVSAGVPVENAGSRSPGVVTPHGIPMLGGVAWRDPFRVVGAPVMSEGTLVVFVSGPRNSLSVEGLRGDSGVVSWRRPESVSFIATGVDFAPAVDGGVALVLSPAGSAASGEVRLMGVSASTGKTLWLGRRAFAAIDAPTVCSYATKDFCLTVGVQGGGSSLVEVNAQSGRVEAVVPHVAQLIGDGIYETDSSTPSIEAIGPRGRVLWTLFVSKTFDGGNLRDGWDFGREGNVEFATVGFRQPGDVQGVFNQTSVGIDRSTGRVLWTDQGAYDCGGLEIAGPVVCTGTGTWTFSTVTNTGTLSPSASAAIEGVNPRTGALIWAVGTTQVWAVLEGNTMPIAGSSELVLIDLYHHFDALDLRTGSVSGVATGGGFWCPTGNDYTVSGPFGAETRVGTAEWYVCDAQTAPTSGPVPAISRVGLMDGGLFVWVAKSGLVASRVVDGPQKHSLNKG